MSGEVRDILAYRRFVDNVWLSNSSASAMMVAFHDLVTDSVSLQFQTSKRHIQYCLKDVIQAFRDTGILENASLAPPVISFNVRGLASDEKLACVQ